MIVREIKLKLLYSILESGPCKSGRSWARKIYIYFKFPFSTRNIGKSGLQKIFYEENNPKIRGGNCG